MASLSPKAKRLSMTNGDNKTSSKQSIEEVQLNTNNTNALPDRMPDTHEMASSTTAATAGPETRARGLKILIAGAGIGGLAAAIGLRRQGHEVHLFEASRFASELGAAIHLAPNANGIMKRWDMDAKQYEAVIYERTTQHFDGKPAMTTEFTGKLADLWQHEWLLAHRVKLHEQLKENALGPSQPGRPAVLHTSKKVVSADPQTATLTFSDGTSAHGDLIIGADGLHSKLRPLIPDCDAPLYSSGKNCFRFMAKTSDVLSDPETAALSSGTGALIVWYLNDRRIVTYPCLSNTLWNFACFHPDTESSPADANSYSSAAHIDDMLHIYRAMPPAVRKLLQKADPDTLKVWRLLDMDHLPMWAHARLALLGDAAHPFLPHQGQGGACAIEDAAALATVLPFDTPVCDIPERLQLYSEIRKGRANTLREYTRKAGLDLDKMEKIDITQFFAFNLGYDEVDNSSQIFREYLWEKERRKRVENGAQEVYSRMPSVFGPMPGPRQDCMGVQRVEGRQATFRTVTIRFRTSRTLMRNLLPTKTNFRFAGVGSACEASWVLSELDGLDWLGGEGYNLAALYIHGTEYTKKNGEKVNGSFVPVLFESLPDAMLSGREELGMPKLFSDIEFKANGNGARVSSSWRGCRWGEWKLDNLKEVGKPTEQESPAVRASQGWMTYRVAPVIKGDDKKTGQLDFAVLHPNEDEKVKTVTRSWTTTDASMSIKSHDWKALPTMHHVIARLAEMPCFRILAARLDEGHGANVFANSQRIE